MKQRNQTKKFINQTDISVMLSILVDDSYWLVWLFGTSTIIGYLMPNRIDLNLQILYKYDL